ncbi:Ymd8 protein [Saccharomycopsis crataegensis]|uniref:Ymd8 protein n=1 Tax=Saccharomycopsis crataegensis TaxID=43959 RepID=A0AAV5QUK5_9ASCO|nr:Ymd8 protein [Saccharomycopsis crataegensis]
MTGSGLHSRSLSDTIDVNYGGGSSSSIATTTTTSNTSKTNFNKPLPPLISSDTNRSSKKKKKNSVRFNLTPIINAPAPPPKDSKYNLGSSRRRLLDDFEEFDIDGDDFESKDSPVATATTLNDDDDDNGGGDLGNRGGGWLQSILHPTKDTLVILVCIVGWYVFSLAISLYNKWMFDKSRLNFPFPIICTSIHQLILFFLSLLLMAIVPKYRPPTRSQVQLGSTTTTTPQSTGGKFKFTEYLMDLRLYLISIVPCALAASGDIGCGNVSFRYITLSLYTMIKSSSIAFVLIFGVLFKLEKLTCNLTSIVAIMIVGVLMMVGGSSGGSGKASGINSDVMFGSLLVLVSSCMSGLRWALTQLVLKQNQYVANPVATIFYLAPPMFASLFLVGSVLENLVEFINNDLWQQKGIVKTIGLLTMPGFLVFFMSLFELKLLQKSHVVTLSIAGVFKELLTIVVSTLVFGDKLTIINCFGLVVTLLDIVWYNYYRYSERTQSTEKYQKVDNDDIELRDV